MAPSRWIARSLSVALLIILTGGCSTGQLDTTFNGRGWVVHDSAAGGHWDDRANGVAIDSAGRIVVVGESYGRYYDMTIWRYDSRGSLDLTFGGRGYVTHHDAAGGQGNDYGKAVTIDADGRIIVVGSSFGAGEDLVVWRYRPDGTLDPTFGPGGKGYTVFDTPGMRWPGERGNAVALGPNGQILVAGYTTTVDTLGYFISYTTVWAFTPQGILDRAFDGAGYNFTDLSNDGRGIVVYPDTGQIVVAAEVYRTVAKSPSMHLWGLTPGGFTDLAFGTGGSVVDSGSSGSDAHSVAIDSMSNLVVTGDRTEFFSETAMAVWRFNRRGVPDATFGTRGDGIVVHNGIRKAHGNAICTIGGGVLVAGYTEGKMGLWALNPDGLLTGSFGTDGPGFTTHDGAAGGTLADVGSAIAVDGNGRIVVAGWSYNANAVPNQDMVTWRFN